MRIRLKLFAILRDRAGCAEIDLELPAGCMVAMAMTRVGERFPAIAAMLPRVAAAVNLQYVPVSTELNEGDELALIPPVSGGVGEDIIRLEEGALDVSGAIEAVSDPAAGGIAVFLGTTRGECNSGGGELHALDYQAYSEMAIGQLHELARRARGRWPICKLVILHRLGRVEVGEPSVVIAVSTPHRAAAFEACQFLIDTLKAEAAIWKKEIWADGGSSWVHPKMEEK